jgi:hypothetical protein
LRATFKRLFSGFELVGPETRFSAGVTQGQPWVADSQDHTLPVGGGMWLMPYVQRHAVDWQRGPGFPGVQPAALAFHDNLCSLLAA